MEKFAGIVEEFRCEIAWHGCYDWAYTACTIGYVDEIGIVT